MKPPQRDSSISTKGGWLVQLFDEVDRFKGQLSDQFGLLAGLDVFLFDRL